MSINQPTSLIWCGFFLAYDRTLYYTIRMTTKKHTSDYKQRLKDQGLVRCEIWVKPDHYILAKTLEKYSRTDDKRKLIKVKKALNPGS